MKNLLIEFKFNASFFLIMLLSIFLFFSFLLYLNVESATSKNNPITENLPKNLETELNKDRQEVDISSYFNSLDDGGDSYSTPRAQDCTLFSQKVPRGTIIFDSTCSSGKD